MKDSSTDENSLNLEQVENLIRLYTQPLKENHDPEIWKGFFCLFYAIFPAFLKNNLKCEYPNKILLEYLLKRGALPQFAFEFFNEDEIRQRINKINKDQQEVYKSYHPLAPKQISSKKDFFNNLSKFERIISIKNYTKNGVKRKYLVLFNHRICIWKRKKHHK